MKILSSVNLLTKSSGGLNNSSCTLAGAGSAAAAATSTTGAGRRVDKDPIIFWHQEGIGKGYLL